jgi:hypothetical protein
MTPAAFWKCTPKKLNVLSKIHTEVNGSNSKSGKGKYKNKPNGNVGYIDQIF